MPNWKKVIVSGSDATLNSLDVSSSITGSALQLGNLGAANEILIVGANTEVTSSNLLAIDTVNQRVGIGTSTPEVKLDLVGESSGEAQVRVDQHDNTSDGPDIRFFKSHNTAASPSAVANNDYIGAVNAFAYDGSTYIQSGFFGFQADGTDGDSKFGLRTRVGGTLTDRIKINSSGDSEFTSNITASGNISASGDITGNSFIKGGGTSAQFLKADGSVDSTSYGTGTVTEVTVGTGLDVSNGTTTPNVTLDLTEVGFGGTAGNLVTDDGDGTVTSQDNLTFDSNTNTLRVLGIPRSEGFISASSDIVAGENIFAGGSGVFGGNVTATDIIVGDDVRLADNSKIVSENTAGTYILLNNDDYWRINANNVNVAQFSSAGVVVNENSAASCDFRVESNNDTHALFVDSGNDKVAIGTSTVGNSLLTIDGDVTATNITASSNITASIVRASEIIGSVQVGAPTIAASDSVATNLIEEETAGGGIEIDTTKANFTGNITASGAISASGTITSAGLITTKDTDGGDTVIQIINSNTDGGVDKGAGIEFLHGSALGALSGNQRAGKILSTKASSYQGTTAAVDSNLEFYTANNDTDTLQLKIDNEGLAAFTGNVSSSGKVYSTNRKNLQCGFQSVGSAAQGTWYGPNSLGPNNTYWATPYGTAAAPGDVSLALGNSGWFVPVKAFVTDATLYIQNVSDPDNYAVTGALQLTNTISYPVTLTSSFSTTTDYTGDLYSTTGVQSAMEEVTITVNQQVDAGVIMYPRFNVNGVTSNWRGTFVVNYYEVK